MEHTNLFFKKKTVLNFCVELIFNSVTLYSVSSSIQRCLKLETIIYTSMYSVLTLPCMNGEHVTDQMKVI